MAELQFAAGAEAVKLAHMDARWHQSWKDTREEINRLPMALHKVRLFTAHQMGGCGMGSDPRTSVVDGNGLHHQIRNLSVHDASAFPTSIGANPQLSVYALSARQSTRLAEKLTA
jgi:choline dehydrogenase-like flavoprotein